MLAFKKTALAVSISLLSMSLVACAGHNKPDLRLHEKTLVVVDAPADPEPAELMQCALRPAGWAESEWAVMTPATRASAERIMKAFGLNADHLDRKVNFDKPGTCPVDNQD